MENQIFQSYVDAWLNKDVASFLSLLSDDISCTECDGASYHGKDTCGRWFRHWFENSENKVLCWEILDSFFDKISKLAFILGLLSVSTRVKSVSLTGVHW